MTLPVGGKKEQPVSGNTGIKSGGADVTKSKSFKGMEGHSAYAPPAKTYVPCGGKKK